MMGNKPKISVIIPAYNVEDYLAELLDSVFSQTFKDYEIIIVNDGSTDGTQKIIDEYKEKYSDVIKAYYQENRGLSASRNEGLKYAKGDYIAFVDADDVIKDCFLEKLYNAVTDHNSDMAKCSMSDFDVSLESAWYACNISDRTIEFEPGYVYSIFNSPCAGLVKKEFLDKYGIRFSEGEQMEDSPYGVVANILANNVAIVDDYLYYHRVNHSNSIMTHVKQGKSDPKVPYNGMRNAAELLNANIKDPIVKNISEYFIANTLACFLTTMYKNCGKGVHKKLCEYCYDYIPEYYPNIWNNPYIFGVKKRNIKKISLFNRTAIKLFVINYKLHLLYPFSVVTCFFLRLAG